MQYEQAIAEYKVALRYVPDDINIVRETGRTVDSWRGIRRAAPVYCQSLPATAQVTIKPQPPISLAPAPVVLDDDVNGSGISLRQLVCNEYQARYLRGFRDHQAVARYQQSIAIEPTNEQAYFDLGQANSALNRTRCAIDAYGRLLTVDPCHRDALTAWRRLNLELRPKTILRLDNLYQDGRQGLANMTYTDYTVAQRYCLGDENEYVEAGYRERVLHPTDDRLDYGEIVYGRVQKKVAIDALAFAEVDVEQYQYGFQTRPTFVSGLQVLTRRDLQVTFSGFLNNVYVNGESVRQDIYRCGPQFEALYRPLRWWELSGLYRYAFYSDNDNMNEVNLRSAFLLLNGRQRLRALSTYQFLTYSQQTIFGPFPNSLVGTIHPYFAPLGFSYTTLGLEWKQWLSCDSFKGANEMWYLAYSGGGVDSNGNGYALLNAQLQYDVTSWLSWTTELGLTRTQGQVYNATGVSTYLVYRWR